MEFLKLLSDSGGFAILCGALLFVVVRQQKDQNEMRDRHDEQQMNLLERYHSEQLKGHDLRGQVVRALKALAAKIQ